MEKLLPTCGFLFFGLIESTEPLALHSVIALAERDGTRAETRIRLSPEINTYVTLMYELKKIGKVFTSKFVGTGPSSYKKRIYRAAV